MLTMPERTATARGTGTNPDHTIDVPDRSMLEEDRDRRTGRVIHARGRGASATLDPNDRRLTSRLHDPAG
jgi:hypothetical protein